MKSTAFLFILIAFLVLGLGACADQPDSAEAQIRRVLSEMEQAIENRDNSDLFKHVSETYQDHRGNNKEALRKFARLYMLRNKNIELFVSIQSLEPVDDNTFALEATALMGAQRDSRGPGLGQLRADSHTVSAVFIRENDTWRLSSMSWPDQRAY